MYSLIKDLLIKEEWNIAIRKRGDKLLFEDKDCGGFKIIKNSFRYWCADPFIISKDGKDYLFFEAYDRIKAKGVIGYRVIENGKVSKMKIALELEKHLSFPYVFEYDGKIYMMPESSGLGKLSVYEATSFPDKWEEKVVLMNKAVVDSVFVINGSDKYIMTLPCGIKGKELHLHKIDDDFIVSPDGSCIVLGKDNARMAGAIVNNSGYLIRPAQDCEKGYGLAMNFNRIVDLSVEYSESRICRIEISDMPKHISKKYVGMHTYNLDENYEVIDLKNKDRFKIGNLINIFYRFKQKGFMTCVRWFKDIRSK